ncbi:MAG: ATP-binding protein, partial [Vicinamibacterales bacterium]|nr:ATP-binding protein [Vicinamibacterales bacterium]
MHDPRTASLLTAFGLTPELRSARETVGTYINSFATVIVDAFFDEDESGWSRLQGDRGADLSRQKRMLKDQLTSLFTEPLDDRLLARLVTAGAAHTADGVEQLRLAGGFERLQEIVLRLSRVNEQIAKDLPIIQKMLRLAAFVILESHGDERDRLPPAGNEQKMTAGFNLLYRIYHVHKEDQDLVAELWRDGRAPPPGGGPCPAALLFDELLGDPETLASLKLNAATTRAAHDARHAKRAEFVAAVAAGRPAGQCRRLYGELRTSDEAFFAVIGKPLEDITAISFLAVNSGFRFIQEVSQSFYDRERFAGDGPDQADALAQELPALLRRTLGWCIEDLDVSVTGMSLGAYDVSTTYVLTGAHLHVGVNLRELPNSLYLRELLRIMLEIVEVNLLSKERERALVEMADAAERANKAKDVFLANMSHELRTPLNAIIGFAQILGAKSDVPDNLRPYFHKIRVAGNNLLSLVNTILDFAKMEAGKIVYTPVETAIDAMVSEVVTIAEPMAREHGVAFSPPPPSGLIVELDPQLIKQVLLNLLSNAIKFTPPGGRVWLEVAAVETRASLSLRVCDTGVGIAPEDIGKLFTPFQQIQNPMQKSVRGTGLGLTIARKIVEDLHGGAIDVASIPGEGSQFNVDL